MKKLPLASIIVPTYNNEDTIALCLRTFIRQTYPMKEIIVVNDGSTDNTATVLSRMAKEYPILHIISTERGGITRARNVGIKYAKGEVVFFGEGDAIYRKDYLTKAVELLITDSKLGGVCLTGAPWIVKSTLITECIDAENRIQRKLLKSGKIQPFYAWVFRRETIEAVGGYDETLFQAEDKDFFLRVKKEGYSIGLITGINWRHKRDQTVWSFAKRNYAGGKTRVLYLLKHRKVRELIRSVGFLWFLIATPLLILFFPSLSYVVFIALSLPIIYKLIFALRFGWNCVKKKKYLTLLPFFSLLRNLSSAVGYTHGLIIVFFRRLVKKPVDWTSMR